MSSSPTAALARNDHFARVFFRYRGDSIGALDALERFGRGCQEVAFVERGDKMGDDFCVGLRKEFHAPFLESRAERRIVLDYAVVHESETAAVRDVRVRVGDGRESVRRPARVRDADRVLAALAFGKCPRKEIVELGDFPRLLVYFYAFCRFKRDARRVVAAILKPPEAVDERPDGRLVP